MEREHVVFDITAKLNTVNDACRTHFAKTTSCI